ncbi:hypothetical protein NIES4071_79570 [Calothrix sp. NIES-4071]|nr:hypothetical protein NIES4071_79570 [Calothrix sp. NIES-4071]BAZ62227.1 hypothetical protein NIES4105_79500 [Calothrix sp. NIES-4105]
MFTTKNSWIEQVYQYVEYYYWCPQALNKQSTEKVGGTAFRQVQERMRSYEVPLNAIFNITLRLLPSRILTNLLSLFVKSSFGQQFALIDVYSAIPEMGNFTQPDIAIETESSRIFIEMKIGANFHLDQIYKYILLHAWLNQKTGYKQPFLLLLSPKSISKQWASTERNQIFTEDESVNSLLMYLKNQDLPIALGDLKSTEFLLPGASEVLESLTIGSATWSEVGNYFNQELESLHQKGFNDGQEVIYKLISDFLTELKNRNLYNNSKA